VVTNGEKIKAAVRKLLLEGVNGEIDAEKVPTPRIDGIKGESSGFGRQAFVQVRAAEVSEKERKLRIFVYKVVVVIRASEDECFRYGYAIDNALRRDVTLGGIAEWSCLVDGTYKPVGPGRDFDGVYTIRVTVTE
jgi:hypothetical protein